ncbi:mCG146950 [Mus musculus]|nr:mCG146950 [Mus musculus]
MVGRSQNSRDNKGTIRQTGLLQTQKTNSEEACKTECFK